MNRTKNISLSRTHLASNAITYHLRTLSHEEQVSFKQIATIPRLSRTHFRNHAHIIGGCQKRKQRAV